MSIDKHDSDALKWHCFLLLVTEYYHILHHVPSILTLKQAGGCKKEKMKRDIVTRSREEGGLGLV